MQDTGKTNPTSLDSGAGRSRTKKKSTLTKLKERREHEMGSSASLPGSDLGNGLVADSLLGTSDLSSPNTNKPTVYHVSTKDSHIPSSPMDTSTPSIKTRPQPKPRTNRRMSSSDLHLEEEMSNVKKDVEDSLNGSSDTVTLQRLKNLKMVTDQSESVDSSLANARFVPKPPVTPRSTKTTSRTPRTSLSSGKREKRMREPWSSGDEHEIEEKKEKNGHEDVIHNNIFDVSDLQMADVADKDIPIPHDSAGKDTFPHVKEKSPTTTQDQTKITARLLKRRNSRDASPVRVFDSKTVESTSDLISIDNNKGSKSVVSDILPNKSPKKQVKSRTRYETQSPEKGKPPLSPKSSPLHSGATFTSKSNPDLKEKKTDCQTPCADDNMPSHGGTKSTQVLYTSTETCRSITTPPSGQLEPISPRSQPPPLPKEFSSHALKTAYKIDPNIRPFTSSSGRPQTHSDTGVSSEDKLSQRSFMSGSILPMITTKEARSRSFLEGSISSATPSMLGLEELERYFPEKKVNILVGSWNLNELKDVTSSLNDFILPEKCDYVQDIYAIGTQENNMNKKEWEVKLQETLGPSHVLFHSVTLGSLHLVVFIRRDLIWFCSAPEDDTLSLRAVTMVKTKGAIGISFTLFGSSFLFINCHLTSDRDNENSRKKNRLGDYFKVIQDMEFKLIKQSKASQNSGSAKKQVDITSLYDVVLWFGDLNFRIERQRHAVEGRVNQITSEKFPNFETLLGGDQLLKFMMEGKIFYGFQEGRINFLPTFKFDVNTDSYDTSAKNRVPSYTDRIMFRSKKKNDITCIHYDAVMELKISDHRPVIGQFEAGIKAGRDNMVYGAGHFDRSVYLEANQRRAANQPTAKKSHSSSVCAIQ